MKNWITFILLLISTACLGQGNSFFPSYNGTITPVVTTQAVTSIGSTTATGNGTVVQRGNPPITERGSCWNTSSNPTVSNSRTSDGSGVGSFTSAMYPFTFGTTYYVRAYAINVLGNYYGDNVTFTPAGPPTVTTDAATNIASTSFTDGGNVTSDGGGTVTARGICYDYATAPTTSSYKKAIGSGTGTFSSSITNQIFGDWKYYVRAYATNGAGTAYGNEVTVTTPCSTVPNVTGITPFGKPWASGVAKIRIIITSATATECGVCYKTSAGPTTADAKTTGTMPAYPEMTFDVTITGLTPGGTYYFRGYGINSCGTGYYDTNGWQDTAGL